MIPSHERTCNAISEVSDFSGLVEIDTPNTIRKESMLITDHKCPKMTKMNNDEHK